MDKQTHTCRSVSRRLTDRKESGGCLALGRGWTGELVFNGYRVSVEEDEKVREMDGGDGSKTM